jgi:hypothetical protein
VEDRVSGIVKSVFLLLFLVVGLPWNLLVIATIVKQRLYTQPTIILLLSLVITDLVLLVLHLPLVAIVGFHGEYLFGNSDNTRCRICGMTGAISVWFSLISIFTISIMSVDRFLFTASYRETSEPSTRSGGRRIVMQLPLSLTSA